MDGQDKTIVYDKLEQYYQLNFNFSKPGMLCILMKQENLLCFSLNIFIFLIYCTFFTTNHDSSKHKQVFVVLQISSTEYFAVSHYLFIRS